MLAKRRQSRSMKVTVDDTESAADALRLISKEQCSSPATSARRHRPQTTHLPASTVLLRVAVVVSQHCLHYAGCSATAKHPV